MVMDALKELLDLQTEDGAILAYRGGNPYPEVTGYCIPTLLAYGKKEEAKKCAQWLIWEQADDGSYLGLDGVPRVFDTAACMEGLRKVNSTELADNSADWIETMRRPDGFLSISPKHPQTELYTCRVESILGNREGVARWLPAWNEAWGPYQRSHYIAYALEGMWKSGSSAEAVTDILAEIKPIIEARGAVPYSFGRNWTVSTENNCTPATAQFAVLYAWVGEYEFARTLANYVHNAWHTDPVSWTLKFLLDAEAAIP
jgi:hypothetical protein